MNRDLAVLRRATHRLAGESLRRYPCATAARVTSACRSRSRRYTAGRPPPPRRDPGGAAPRRPPWACGRAIVVALMPIVARWTATVARTHGPAPRRRAGLSYDDRGTQLADLVGTMKPNLRRSRGTALRRRPGARRRPTPSRRGAPSSRSTLTWPTNGTSAGSGGEAGDRTGSGRFAVDHGDRRLGKSASASRAAHAHVAAEAVDHVGDVRADGKPRTDDGEPPKRSAIGWRMRLDARVPDHRRRADGCLTGESPDRRADAPCEASPCGKRRFAQQQTGAARGWGHYAPVPPWHREERRRCPARPRRCHACRCARDRLASSGATGDAATLTANLGSVWHRFSSMAARDHAGTAWSSDICVAAAEPQTAVAIHLRPGSSRRAGWDNGRAASRRDTGRLRA